MLRITLCNINNIYLSDLCNLKVLRFAVFYNDYDISNVIY